jgi:hypothetical protein
MQELVRLVGRELDERHVVRYAGVVDEHREVSRRTPFSYCFHTGVSAEVGNQGNHLDVGKRSRELIEPIATPANDYEVVALGAESESEGAADAGGGPCD